jgi:hypothetical protein
MEVEIERDDDEIGDPDSAHLRDDLAGDDVGLRRVRGHA